MSKKSRGLWGYLTIFVVLVIVGSLLFSNQPDEPEFKYSEVVAFFAEDKVENFDFDIVSGELIFKLRGSEIIYVYRVPNAGLFVQSAIYHVEEYNIENPDAPVEYDLQAPQDTSWLINLLPTLLLFIPMGFLFYFTLRQTRGGSGMNSFGKAKVRVPDQGRKVTFEDVAGADEEKAELVEIVDFLKNPSKFNALGARIPKGVLLVGPPGTGKTLLARAVAGEANAPFFSISGSDFVEMFVGVGASRVRDLFDNAKKNSPSIIFIDEIDAVGRQRGAGLGGGHDEREQTLNQLLVEMDGFGSNSGVIIIAATNRRDILDPALLRPGRFDRQIIVGYPDVVGREAILKVHTKSKPMGPDVNLKTIAQTTAGFTGADLENILNEAALLAARRDRKAITMFDIEEATIKVVAGPEKKSRMVTDKEKKLTAYHEAGHALCHHYLESLDGVHQISIIPRGMAGGYTMSLPSEDKNYRTKGEMFESIVSLLGGRVAEALILDDISTGASNDIERSTGIAKSMVTRYGFSDKLGPIVYGQGSQEVFLGRDISSGRNYSETVAEEIDSEVRDIIANAYKRAEDLLELHMDQLTLVAEYLIVHEKLDGPEFVSLMTHGKVIPAPVPEPIQPIMPDAQSTENTVPTDSITPTEDMTGQENSSEQVQATAIDDQETPPTDDNPENPTI